MKKKTLQKAQKFISAKRIVIKQHIASKNVDWIFSSMKAQKI
eukprot:UN22901